MSSATQESKTPLHAVAESPTPQLYRYSYFSREAAGARKDLVPAFFLPLIYNAILLWACVALFFGSLLDSNDVSRIKVTAVNLDDGSFGQGVIDRIQASFDQPGPHLKWLLVNDASSGGIDDAWSRNLVLEERTWAVLEISANASSELRNALSQGDSNYNPLDAATLYFASARQQVTTLSVAVPAVMGLVGQIIPELAANSTATFLQSVESSSNSTAMQTALRCPQCLASPFAIKQVDLVPFSSAVAFGPLSTGLIFLLVFTFNIVTVLRAGVERHGHLFNLQTHVAFRTIAALSSYFVLSLMYTLAILAFSVPLTGHFSSKGAGFMALWMLNWCTMSACGFAIESVSTVIGLQWAPFFLNIFLITNASGAFASFEVMPGFYKYGYAMPFYHSIQATRTIMFGTKSYIGLNFGVLIAWVAVGWIGICLGTAWRINRGRRTGIHRVP